MQKKLPHCLFSYFSHFQTSVILVPLLYLSPFPLLASSVCSMNTVHCAVYSVLQCLVCYKSNALIELIFQCLGGSELQCLVYQVFNVLKYKMSFLAESR